MRTRLKIVAVLGVLFGMVLNSSAIQGVQLSFLGSDVVLRWPSQPCQTFIVGYKPDLQPGTQWTLLTTTLAGAGGNETTFTHVGVFQGGGGQMLAMAGSGGASLTLASTLTAEETEARRIAYSEAAKQALARMVAQLEAAMAKAQATLAKRKALRASGLADTAIQSSSSALAPEGAAAANVAMQQTTAGMGFYFVAEYAEDSDGDGLTDGIELTAGLSLVNADSDGDLISDGDEDSDADGVSNLAEAFRGTFINESDSVYPPPLLPFGTIFFIDESFTLACETPGPVAAAGGTVSGSQELLFLDAAPDTVHGISALEVSPGVLNVRLHSIYIGPEFGAATIQAANGPENPFPPPSAAERAILKEANGNTDIGSGRVGNISQDLYDQLSQNTLDWAAWEAEYGLRKTERLIQEIESGQRAASEALRRSLRANLVTQAKRLGAATSSLARRFGRAVGRYLPFIGGIMILANASAVAEQWNTAFQDYANDIRNGDDTTGSAAILAALSNDLAPGAGNFVLNYLLR